MIKNSKNSLLYKQKNRRVRTAIIIKGIFLLCVCILCMYSEKTYLKFVQCRVHLNKIRYLCGSIWNALNFCRWDSTLKNHKMIDFILIVESNFVLLTLCYTDNAPCFTLPNYPLSTMFWRICGIAGDGKSAKQCMTGGDNRQAPPSRE